jgi:hypothetical protein
MVIAIAPPSEPPTSVGWSAAATRQSPPKRGGSLDQSGRAPRARSADLGMGYCTDGGSRGLKSRRYATSHERRHEGQRPKQCDDEATAGNSVPSARSRMEAVRRTPIPPRRQRLVLPMCAAHLGTAIGYVGAPFGGQARRRAVWNPVRRRSARIAARGWTLPRRRSRRSPDGSLHHRRNKTDRAGAKKALKIRPVAAGCPGGGFCSLTSHRCGWGS